MFTVHKFKQKNGISLELKQLDDGTPEDESIRGSVLVALAQSGNGGAEIQIFKGELLTGVLIRKSYNNRFTIAHGNMIYKKGTSYYLCDPADNGVTNVQELHTFKKMGVNFYYTTSYPMVYSNDTVISR